MHESVVTSHIGLYIVTRTVRIPFFGPYAGHVEEMGAIDIVSKLVELALVLVLVTLALMKRHTYALQGI